MSSLDARALSSRTSLYASRRKRAEKGTAALRLAMMLSDSHADLKGRMSWISMDFWYHHCTLGSWRMGAIRQRSLLSLPLTSTGDSSEPRKAVGWNSPASCNSRWPNRSLAQHEMLRRDYPWDARKCRVLEVGFPCFPPSSLYSLHIWS